MKINPSTFFAGVGRASTLQAMVVYVLPAFFLATFRSLRNRVAGLRVSKVYTPVWFLRAWKVLKEGSFSGFFVSPRAVMVVAFGTVTGKGMP